MYLQGSPSPCICRLTRHLRVDKVNNKPELTGERKVCTFQKEDRHF